jgi:hypothetical protein
MREPKAPVSSVRYGTGKFFGNFFGYREEKVISTSVLGSDKVILMAHYVFLILFRCTVVVAVEIFMDRAVMTHKT